MYLQSDIYIDTFSLISTFITLYTSEEVKDWSVCIFIISILDNEYLNKLIFQNLTVEIQIMDNFYKMILIKNEPINLITVGLLRTWLSCHIMVLWEEYFFFFCVLQNPVLWDERSDGSGGGQGGDHAAGPGHEADGAVRRQTARRAGQWQRGHQAGRRAAQWEEVCMLDQETTSQSSSVVRPFHPPRSPSSFTSSAIFDCMFVRLLLLTPFLSN